MESRPASPPPASFSEHFSRADFRKVAENRLSDGNHMAYGSLLAATVEPALRAHLGELRGRGLLGPVSGGAGRNLRFVEAWNRMSAGGGGPAEEADWRAACGPFSSCLAFQATYPMQEEVKGGADREKAIDDAYARIVQLADAGDFRWFQVGFDKLTCPVTEELLKLDVRKWKTVVGTSTRGRDELAPAVPPVHPGVSHIEVDFPSGEILVADWFRIEAFNDVVREKSCDGPSINSFVGREASAARYARDFGFVSVNLANTTARILDVGGALVFGRTAYDEAADEEVPLPAGVGDLGSVYLGLWAVTAIDRARLVDIVAAAKGPDEAERLVAAYVANPRNGVTALRTEPGVQHVYFSGDYRSFPGRFASPDLDLDPDVRPMLVMSPAPLRLSPEAVPEDPAPSMRRG